MNCKKCCEIASATQVPPPSLPFPSPPFSFPLLSFPSCRDLQTTRSTRWQRVASRPGRMCTRDAASATHGWVNARPPQSQREVTMCPQAVHLCQSQEGCCGALPVSFATVVGWLTRPVLTSTRVRLSRAQPHASRFSANACPCWLAMKQQPQWWHPSLPARMSRAASTS